MIPPLEDSSAALCGGSNLLLLQQQQQQQQQAAVNSDLKCMLRKVLSYHQEETSAAATTPPASLTTINSAPSSTMALETDEGLQRFALLENYEQKHQDEQHEQQSGRQVLLPSLGGVPSCTSLWTHSFQVERAVEDASTPSTAASAVGRNKCNSDTSLKTGSNSRRASHHIGSVRSVANPVAVDDLIGGGSSASTTASASVLNDGAGACSRSWSLSENARGVLWDIEQQQQKSHGCATTSYESVEEEGCFVGSTADGSSLHELSGGDSFSGAVICDGSSGRVVTYEPRGGCCDGRSVTTSSTASGTSLSCGESSQLSQQKFVGGGVESSSREGSREVALLESETLDLLKMLISNQQQITEEGEADGMQELAVLTSLLNSMQIGVVEPPPPTKQQHADQSSTFHADGSLNLNIFKVYPCRNESHIHDRKNCPFYHSQRDRRRLPTTYKAEQCDENFDTEEDVACLCPKGDACDKCHNRHELLYHPAIYKQRFCSSYNHILQRAVQCHRGRFCAFAHSREEIRSQLFPEHIEREPSSQFFMMDFKTLWCPYGIQHDWHGCLYAHTYQDCRRTPHIGYGSEPCPYWQKDLHSADYKRRCPYGTRCPYSHGSKEQLYHPAYYKSMPCADFKVQRFCPRGHLCAFYHDASEKRTVGAAVDEIAGGAAQDKFDSTPVNGYSQCLPTALMGLLQRNFKNPPLFNLDDFEAFGHSRRLMVGGNVSGGDLNGMMPQQQQLGGSPRRATGSRNSSAFFKTTWGGQYDPSSGWASRVKGGELDMGGKQSCSSRQGRLNALRGVMASESNSSAASAESTATSSSTTAAAAAGMLSSSSFDFASSDAASRSRATSSSSATTADDIFYQLIDGGIRTAGVYHQRRGRAAIRHHT